MESEHSSPFDEFERLAECLVVTLTNDVVGDDLASRADLDALQRLGPVLQRVMEAMSGPGEPAAIAEPGQGRPIQLDGAAVANGLGKESGDVDGGERPGGPGAGEVPGQAFPQATPQTTPQTTPQATPQGSVAEGSSVGGISPYGLSGSSMFRGGAHPTFRGTSTALPFPSVIVLICNTGSTGVLCVQTPEENLSFEFVFGAIVGCASDDRDDAARLGRLAMDMGFLSSEDLRRSLWLTARERGPLGAVLVGEGLLTPEQLTDVLFAQLVARLDRVCRSRVFTYSYVVGPVHVRDDALRVTASDLSFGDDAGSTGEPGDGGGDDGTRTR